MVFLVDIFHHFQGTYFYTLHDVSDSVHTVTANDNSPSVVSNDDMVSPNQDENEGDLPHDVPSTRSAAVPRSSGRTCRPTTFLDPSFSGQQYGDKVLVTVEDKPYYVHNHMF